MTNSNTLNGQPKKTLANQLDRLDTIIDALDQVLPEVVAETVQQALSCAVQQTVETVLQEVLGRPELLATVAQQVPPSPAAASQHATQDRKPSLLRRLGSWLSGKVVRACTRLSEATKAGFQAVRRLVGALCRKVQWALSLPLCAVCKVAGWARRHPLSVALAGLTGLAVGISGYLAGPMIASAALGLSSALVSLAALLRMSPALQSQQ